jgi:hypothetical protein
MAGFAAQLETVRVRAADSGPGGCLVAGRRRRRAPARQRRPAQTAPATAQITTLSVIGEPRAQAAVALAQALRDRGHAAIESAAADGTARVLVISRPAIRLTEHAHVCTHDGEPWF